MIDKSTDSTTSSNDDVPRVGGEDDSRAASDPDTRVGGEDDARAVVDDEPRNPSAPEKS